MLLTLYIGYVNFTPNLYLSGWDNLQTELNPLLGMKRALFASWQEYQGLGLTSGMAHASDLIRTFISIILALVFPQSMVRYIFHVLMFYIGGAGAYKFFSHFNHSHSKRIFPFLGALLYMLNFGTLQLFFVPYEAFSIFYAALPWELWIFTSLLVPSKKVGKWDLFIFMIINLLATPQSYVQTLFVVYVLILVSITVWTFFTNVNKWGVFLRATSLLLLICVINLFWILPQIYFLKTSGAVVQASKINQLSTETTYYQNFEKGTLDNLLFFRGFYYDLFSKDNQLLFFPWKMHFQNVATVYIGTVFFTFMLIGVITKKKNMSIFLIPFFMVTIPLLNRTPLFSQINELLRESPFISQIFRSPFTKFIIPYSLLFCFFFTVGVEKVCSLIKQAYFRYLVSILILFAIIFQSLPVFHGYLFSSEMKVNMPNEYHQAIEYFKKQDSNKRIALLPEYTFWGWFLTRWGYNGSGFLWYGIEQPILSRTFDVWSEKNEGYFWELKYAIESKDSELFQAVLSKYNVSYLLIDKTLLPVTSTTKGMQYKKIEQIIDSIPAIHQTFKKGGIEIYEIKSNTDMVQIINTPISVNPVMNKADMDIAFYENSTYISPENDTVDEPIIYPFLDLSSQTYSTQPNWTLTENSTMFQLASNMTFDYKKYDVNVSTDIFEYESLNDSGKFTTASAVIDYGIDESGKLLVNIPKVLIKTYYPNDFFIEKCDSGKKGRAAVNKTSSSLESQAFDGAALCFSVSNDHLNQGESYLIAISAEQIQGRPLLFYVLDKTNKESVLEDRLRNHSPYLYIIPPRDDNSLGYSLTFQANSYMGSMTQTSIKNVSMYIFPFKIINSMKFIPKAKANDINNDFFVWVDWKKNNYYSYSIKNINLSSDSQKTVVLSQAFDPGWKAYLFESVKDELSWIKTYLPFLFGREIKEHVLVNNWANGWNLTNLNLKDDTPNTHIVIMFWPQYLEYIGFFVLLIPLGILISKRRRHHTHPHPVN